MPMVAFSIVAHLITHYLKVTIININPVLFRKFVKNWDAVKLKVADTSVPIFCFHQKGQIFSLATNPIRFSRSDSFTSFLFENISTRYPSLNNHSLPISHFFQAKNGIPQKAASSAQNSVRQVLSLRTTTVLRGAAALPSGYFPLCHTEC